MTGLRNIGDLTDYHFVGLWLGTDGFTCDIGSVIIVTQTNGMNLKELDIKMYYFG